MTLRQNQLHSPGYNRLHYHASVSPSICYLWGGYRGCVLVKAIGLHASSRIDGSNDYKYYGRATWVLPEGERKCLLHLRLWTLSELSQATNPPSAPLPIAYSVTWFGSCNTLSPYVLLHGGSLFQLHSKNPRNHSLLSHQECWSKGWQGTIMYMHTIYTICVQPQMSSSKHQWCWYSSASWWNSEMACRISSNSAFRQYVGFISCYYRWHAWGMFLDYNLRACIYFLSRYECSPLIGRI